MGENMYRADLIRAEMGRQNLSRAALAAKSRLNVNTVAAICRGKERIEVPTLKKVADSLGLPMADLFTFESRLQKAAA
jgi:transcriptional regulator with XRE-family HTH domain